MKILRYGLSSWFENSVPIFAVVVTRKRQFIHYERILHWQNNFNNDHCYNTNSAW